MPAADAPQVAGAPDCTVFPADNVWNVKVDGLDVATNSSTIVSTIGSSRSFHMDFGSYAGYGIPYQVVDGSTTLRSVAFDYDDESDPGPYPIPTTPLIEDGSDGHMLLVDRVGCKLYELFAARQSASGAWHAGSGAIWDLSSNALRPDGWTSADAAGLPILPGLVRYDEVAAGVIAHALRFTVPQTRDTYIYPATHEASSSHSASLPPMGLRVRLKSTVSLSRAVARREGHRGRAAAVRDDPRRQRLALVHLGRQRPALRRRRPPRAGPVPRLGPRGGGHERAGQRPVALRPCS